MSTQSYSHFAQGFPQVLRLTPPSCSPLFHTFIHSPLSRKPPWRTAPPSVNIILLPCKKGDRHRPVSSDCRQPPLEKSLAEFRRPQTPEGKEAPSFPATCASEMTPLMTDGATFLQESSPVRHASLCRKRPKAFFDKLKAPYSAFAGYGAFLSISSFSYPCWLMGLFMCLDPLENVNQGDEWLLSSGKPYMKNQRSAAN